VDRLRPEDLEEVALSLSELLEQGAHPEDLAKLPKEALLSLIEGDDFRDWAALEKYLALKGQPPGPASSTSSPSDPKTPSPSGPTTT